MIKGILHPEDAVRATAVGADGIIVSNHGGRQLDLAPSPLEVLPAIREAVGPDQTLMIDSGVRRGTDILVARCLGAQFAFVGRATLARRAAGEKPPAPRAALALTKSKTYRSAADAPETLRAYKADFDNFRAWCEAHGFQPLPAEPETVGAYLAAPGLGYALPTLRRRVAAIARAHRMAKQPLDTRHPAIRENLRGIARTHGEPPRRSAALATEDIKRLIATCGTDLAGLRDRALLLLGFAGALRRSDLIGLDLAHLRPTPLGMRLLVARSKTDKAGEGVGIGIVRGSTRSLRRG